MEVNEKLLALLKAGAEHGCESDAKVMRALYLTLSELFAGLKKHHAVLLDGISTSGHLDSHEALEKHLNTLELCIKSNVESQQAIQKAERTFRIELERLEFQEDDVEIFVENWQPAFVPVELCARMQASLDTLKRKRELVRFLLNHQNQWEYDAQTKRHLFDSDVLMDEYFTLLDRFQQKAQEARGKSADKHWCLCSESLPTCASFSMGSLSMSLTSFPVEKHCTRVPLSIRVPTSGTVMFTENLLCRNCLGVMFILRGSVASV